MFWQTKISPAVAAVILGSIIGLLVGFFHSIPSYRHGNGLIGWIVESTSEAVTWLVLGAIISATAIRASHLLRTMPTEQTTASDKTNTKAETYAESDEAPKKGPKPEDAKPSEDTDDEDTPQIKILRSEIFRVSNMREKLRNLHMGDLSKVRRRLSAMDNAIDRGRIALESGFWKDVEEAIENLRRFEAPNL